LPENVAGFSATGEVTPEDYKSVIVPIVDKKIANFGKIRLFLHLGPGFKGFTSGAMREDAEMGLKNWEAWEKIAVVTDVDWIRHTVRAFSWIMPGRVKIYENQGYSEGIQWVQM
jgi:hypothetical protein